MEKKNYKKNWFGVLFIASMIIVFILNLIISDYNRIRIILTGGGDIIEILGTSFQPTLINHQWYRLLSYALVQPAIWHLYVNVVAIWYLSSYLERKLGTALFVIVFVIGLAVSGTVIIILLDGFHYGASPAVFTWLGVLFIQGIKDKNLMQEYKEQNSFRFFVAYLILGNIIGIPAFVFHLIGFFTGVVIGLLPIFGRVLKNSR